MHAHLQREDTFTMVETLKYKCFCVQLSHISQAFCSFEKSLDSTNIWSKTVDARAKLQWRKSTDSVRLRHFAACSSVLTLETAYLTFWKEKKKSCGASYEPVCNYKQHLVSDSMYGALRFVHWFAVIQWRQKISHTPYGNYHWKKKEEECSLGTKLCPLAHHQKFKSNDNKYKTGKQKA